MNQGLLDGRRILVVDDEKDVLDTLVELLPMCEIRRASTFGEARKLLETLAFDAAILDIMGVDGYRLLDLAREKGVMAIMLTAHALSTADTVKSYEKGAASYIPKEEMANIRTYLEDVLEAREKGKQFWWRWLDRFGAYYDRKFGPEWQEDQREFWEKFKKYERL
jgi:CheY-like chemotaxis protein